MVLRRRRTERRLMDIVAAIVIGVEGALDRVAGRPRTECPYDARYASGHREAWLIGWDEAHSALETRLDEEAARWLRDAA